MKRSFQILCTIMLALLVTAGMDIQAQSEAVRESKSVSISSSNDGQITLKVTTKQGDDTRIFEKTYESYEEMYEDPELEEYGITAKDLSFGAKGFSFGSPNSNGRFFSMPNFSFFHNGDEDEDSPWSQSFRIDIDSLMDQMDRFQGNGPFSFRFGAPGQHFDMDSLMSGFGGKGFFFDMDDFDDMEEFREKMMDRFKDMDFDFDFDDDGNGTGFRSWSWGNGDEDDPRVISRVKVFIRSARDADKEKVGSDEMEDLQIKDISFYPNPSDGRFELELETGNDMPVFIKIIGPNGEEVYSKNGVSSDGFYDFNIDISTQREGIYILQVIQNGHALTKRIIIE